ncbi:MAG: hypothetical protein RL571_1531 [Pseudomonadota bacterium]|jgi:hypothetical protein
MKWREVPANAGVWVACALCLPLVIPQYKQSPCCFRVVNASKLFVRY